MSNIVRGRQPRILLVEDELADQVLVRRALDGVETRFELQVVSDGEEALDYLFRRAGYADPSCSPRPDLILLDLNLPKIDGRKVLETLRNDQATMGIPVVVLTTSEQPEDIVQSYRLGANSYISKPVAAKQYLEVAAALERYWFQLVSLPPNS